MTNIDAILAILSKTDWVLKPTECAEAFCEEFEQKLIELKSNKSLKHIARTRGVIAFFLREGLKLSKEETSVYFNRASMHHQIKGIKHTIAQDGAYGLRVRLVVLNLAQSNAIKTMNMQEQTDGA